MARMDFPPTKEGFEEFKKYVKNYMGTGKMKLIITEQREAILKTNLATRYDSAYIQKLDDEQLKELHELVGENIDIWHVERLYWDEEVKVKKVE